MTSTTTISYGIYQYKLFDDKQKATEFMEQDDVNVLAYEENFGQHVVFFQYIYRTVARKALRNTSYPFVRDYDDDYDWEWDAYNKEWVKVKVKRGRDYYTDFNWEYGY